MRNGYFGLLVSLVSTFGEAEAEDRSRMANYFSQKIRQVSSVMKQENQRPSPDGSWMLETINFDLSPNVSFGVSKVLNITVSPEIDFVLTLEE